MPIICTIKTLLKKECRTDDSGELNGSRGSPCLYKKFGSVEVLKGISAEAFKGDVISLISASGSGKSTVLRSINLLETPTSGEIYVHGEAVKFTTNKKG